MVFFIQQAFFFNKLQRIDISASFNRANSDEKRVNLIETFSSILSKGTQRKWLNRLYEISNNNSRDASAAYLFWSNLAKPYLETLIYFSDNLCSIFNFLTESVSSSKLSELILFFVLAAVRSLQAQQSYIGNELNEIFQSSINQIYRI